MNVKESHEEGRDQKGLGMLWDSNQGTQRPGKDRARPEEG